MDGGSAERNREIRETKNLEERVVNHDVTSSSEVKVKRVSSIDSKFKMSDPEKQNVSRDVLATAGDFLDCPRTYFALRRACRCLFERMDALCPVTITTFVWGPLRDCKEALCRHVRIVGLGFGSDPLDVLTRDLSADWMLPHIAATLGLLSVNRLVKLSAHDLHRVLGLALSGKLPGHTRMLARAFARHVHCCWADVDGPKSLEDFRICLDELTQSRDKWKACIACALRGGSTDCVTLALARSGMSLRDVPCAEEAAVEGGNLALVQQFYKSEWDLGDAYGLLALAAARGHLAVCRYLLDLGAPADVNGWGLLASHSCVPLAALTGRPPMRDDLALAELLVSRGADILRRVNWLPGTGDPVDVNLLQLAACHGRIDMCKFLLAAGFPGCPADVLLSFHDSDFEPALLDLFEDLDVCNEDNLFGYAITAAAGYGNARAFTYLLECGVKLGVCGGRDGHTPLTALLGEKLDPENISLVCDLLEECPELVNMPTRGGVYPMFLMARYEDTEYVCTWHEVYDILIEYGANPAKLCEPDMLTRYHPETTFSLRRPEAKAASHGGVHDPDVWSSDESEDDWDDSIEEMDDETDLSSYGDASMDSEEFEVAQASRDSEAFLAPPSFASQMILEPTSLASQMFVARPSRHFDEFVDDDSFDSEEFVEDVDDVTRRWIAGGLDIHAMVNGKTTAEILAEFEDHVNLGSVLRLGGQLRPSEALRLIHSFDPDDDPLMFELLLSRVDDLHASDLSEPEGLEDTVVHYLVRNSYPDMFKQVLARRPDIHKRNALGKDVFAWLFQYEPIVAKKDADSLADMLVAAGADIDTRDLWGQTPLWTVVQRGDSKYFKTLIRLGVNVDIPNKQRVYPIDLAYFAQQFVADLVELDIDDEVEFKRTPTAHTHNQVWPNTATERSIIYRDLKPLTARTPHIPSSPIQFATDNGLLTMAGLLRNPESGWNGRDRPRPAEIIKAARRQRLDELRAMSAAGARFDFTYSGHTPLTACLSGWTVRGIPGCFTMKQVAEFLVSQCPGITITATSEGLPPMTCMEQNVPHKRERAELEQFLARCI